jgi:hypothetical protein
MSIGATLPIPTSDGPEASSPRGSVAEELVAFGVGPAAAGLRVERLAESLDVITRL